jgi:hypothetical protein
MLDGYYILREGAEFVAYEQERGCRFHEASFTSLQAAEHYVHQLRSAQSALAGAEV